MGKKRTLTLLTVLMIVGIAGAGSWFAGTRIDSPAEAAARTAPPEPSPILVPIEERVLTSHIVTRGAARYGLPQIIALVPSALKGEAGVITSLPARNTQVNEGDALLTVSGRPYFVLQGESPAYRDFIPGISGADVRQLESALERLGFDPGPLDGVYDEQTGAAVSEWYAAGGWQPFGATVDQLAQIRALERELATAKNDKLTAEEAVSTVAVAVGAAVAEMEGSVSAAAANVSAAAAALKELQIIRDALWSDHATDQERAIADQNLQAAKVAEDAAKIAESSARTGGNANVRTAQDAVTAAEREAQTAAELVDQIAAELVKLRRDAGVKVPIDEIVFIPALPVRVERIDVAVGDAAGGPLLTVTNNQLALDSALPLDEAPLVEPGMQVAIDEPDLGIKATGVVSRVADNPGTDGVDGFHIYFETLVEETAGTLEGFSLRMTIPVQSTGEAVIVVPVSAVSLAADGTSRVQVQQDDGSLAFVVVEPGLSADGFVAVTSPDQALSPDQLVVIGYEAP